MTIDIHYEKDPTGVVFTVTGKVTGEDILAAHKEAVENDSFQHQKYWLIDRTQCAEFQPRPDELIEISKFDNIAAKDNPTLLVAIVSISDLQFGMSRLYCSYIDENGFKTAVFKTREEAQEWITSKLQE